VYGLEQAGKRRVAVINKRAEAFALTLPAGPRSVLTLSGPTVDAKTGIALAVGKGSRERRVTVGAYSAMLFTL
jgi:hypothetical protein